jgi:hypothetical protein
MEHPRIALLRSQVYSLPLDGHGRAVLLKSIEYFREQLVAPAPRARREGRDDLAARRQAATSGMAERDRYEQYGGAGRC